MPSNERTINHLGNNLGNNLDDVITQEELRATAQSIASLQLSSGMIPWFVGGHCDPWNHVETAMALDVMGMHEQAQRAYEWLTSVQREDGSWFNYYLPDGSVEETKLDTNVCAYIGTGVWHHWMSTNDKQFVARMWPAVKRAMEWVLAMRRPDGTILWAREVNASPWDYALLTGCSSIRHALHCAANIGAIVGDSQPEWRAAADAIDEVINTNLAAFEPKLRWAMDWYYPVLTGALTGTEAKTRIAMQWEEFVIPSRGVRCVNDEDWVTAAETAECSLAHSAIGDIDTAKQLLSWTNAHRTESGAYLTGIVYPDRIVFPADECSAYTGAAVILAANAISGDTAASQIFGASTVLD